MPGLCGVPPQRDCRQRVTHRPDVLRAPSITEEAMMILG